MLKHKRRFDGVGRAVEEVGDISIVAGGCSWQKSEGFVFRDEFRNYFGFRWLSFPFKTKASRP